MVNKLQMLLIFYFFCQFVLFRRGCKVQIRGLDWHPNTEIQALWLEEPYEEEDFLA